MKISQEKVWMKYYPSKVPELPRNTVYGYLKEINKNHLDDVAVNYYGAKITYKQLIERIDICANAFTALGVKTGDIISMVSVGIPESIEAVYALNKIGAVANMVDPRMDVDSIRRMVNESGSKVLIVLDIAFPKVAKIMDDIKQDKIIVQSVTRSLPLVKKIIKSMTTKTDITYNDTVIKWNHFIDGGKNTTAKEAPYVGDATVAIAYTGGTTGFPKGVMLTNDSMNSVAFNFQYSGLDAHPKEKFLGIIPIFTSYGMVCGLHMPLCYGVELIPIPAFKPAEFGKLVKQFRPNHMISTPAFYEMMMNSKEVQDMDLSFLITMGSGGDTMNAGLETKLHAFMYDHGMKYPLAQGYGMSELSAAASFCVNNIYKSGSVGIPSLTLTVSVFDPETGEELGYNEPGEVCITGPSMMKGYFNRPEETANVMRLHDDGQVWVHSGDIGYMDEDGFIFIIGRVKRMITRFDGHKVFPVNLESMVAERTDVRNCSVVGVNDMEHSQGHYPVIFVELAEGVDKDAVCKEIYLDCNTRAEERGRPVAVVAIDQIPLTGMGKNDYRTLEKEYVDFDYKAWQNKL